MTTSYRLSDLATHVNGKAVGDLNALISGLCPLDEPDIKAISFLKEPTPSHFTKNDPRNYAALFVSDKMEPEALIDRGNFIIVPDPYAALVSVIPLFVPKHKPTPGISDKAEIAQNAHIGTNVHIGAFVSVGERCVIGDDVVLYPQVTVYHDVTIGSGSILHAGAVIREGTIIGKNSVIQSGAVIGADGFGYVPDPKLGLQLIPQIGKVILNDNVDIGANSCIDRATLGTTQIGQSTKVDNIVQIGHNTKIGKHSIVCGYTGIAGSCSIGDQVVIAGGVGVADHMTIASGARIGGKSTVIMDVREPGDYAGHPVVPAKIYRRNMIEGKSLADSLKDIRQRLSKLEGKE